MRGWPHCQGHGEVSTPQAISSVLTRPESSSQTISHTIHPCQDPDLDDSRGAHALLCQLGTDGRNPTCPIELEGISKWKIPPNRIISEGYLPEARLMLYARRMWQEVDLTAEVAKVEVTNGFPNCTILTNSLPCAHAHEDSCSPIACRCRGHLRLTVERSGVRMD